MARTSERTKRSVPRVHRACLTLTAALLLAAGTASLASAEGTDASGPNAPFARTEQRAACMDADPLRRPFFGDTHVHTAFSFDASSQDTRNTPRDAYRFAKGERVGIQPYDAAGKPLRHAQLDRPLDFTVVSDHAELLGEVRACNDETAFGYDSDYCWIWQNMRPLAMLPVAMRTMVGKQRMALCGKNGEGCRSNARDAWKDIREAAEEAYDRTAACSFTSFIGYEFTATGGAAENLHRNVLFRNEKVPALPPSWVETESAYALWKTLEKQCVEGIPGCDALTIPHNSNISGAGLMFETAKLRTAADAGRPVDREEALARQRWEPLIEIMQHKGDSECLLGGDTVDEACGFEKLGYDTFAGANRVQAGGGTIAAAGQPKHAAMVREALKKGLRQQVGIGANSLKYGIIASTDTHLGTPGLVKESDPKGHGGAGRNADAGLQGLPDNPEYNPGGLAVVWSEENSRDALFAGMQRRETYGTSGTRPVLRFFGGWGYDKELCEKPDFAARGYAGGVPMGGDLPRKRGRAKAPTFAVSALQDPGTDASPGTPLQRIQIVKGWIDSKGNSREKVYDVAGGDNGASVDTRTCQRRGDGERSLCSVWSDPNFKKGEPAFYYTRVLENPTCRWSQYLCAEAGVDCSDSQTIPPGFEPCCAADHRPVQQERAWSSPIWYTP